MKQENKIAPFINEKYNLHVEGTPIKDREISGIKLSEILDKALHEITTNTEKIEGLCVYISETIERFNKKSFSHNDVTIYIPELLQYKPPIKLKWTGYWFDFSTTDVRIGILKHLLKRIV